jgi:AraC family transcriptional regulator
MTRPDPQKNREDRIEFTGARLAKQEIAAHAINEHFIEGFYMKEIVYPLGYKVPPHWHRNASLFVVFSGLFTEFYGSKRIDCTPLDVVLTPAGVTHSEHLDKKGTRSFLFEFEPTWLNRLRELSVNLDMVKVFHGGPVGWLTLRLYREYLRMDEVSNIAIEGLALELAVEISRHDAKRHAAAPYWLLQARDLLHDCFSRRLSLNEIATSVGIHPVHLASTFRKHYGCTIGDYIRKLRIDFTCRELTASDVSIANIAVAAGFSDQSHLARTFKQVTGMSPAEFRTLAKKQINLRKTT